MLDFEIFKKSPFYHKTRRRIRYNYSSDDIEVSDSNTIIVNASILNDDSLLEIASENISERYTLLPLDLYHLLNTSELNYQFRKIIINQWIEVRNIIYSLDKLPSRTNLLIIPENTLFPRHKHSPSIVQTLSFMYNYNYTLVNNNYLEIEDIKYVIPPLEKTVIVMNNNPLHEVFIESGWSFIWVNDYRASINVPPEKISNFRLIN